MTNLDFNTIDLDKLNALPVYNIPSSYHLQRDPGNGCAGDAPGYPTYFTRSVYTKSGNTPSKGTTMVITGPDGVNHVVATADDSYEKTQNVLHSLWKPLPINHERVRLWITDQYRHFKNCYFDPSKKPREDGRIVIFPVPSYKLRSFVDDTRFSDEWRNKEMASIEQANVEIIAMTEAIATPDNHSAVVNIREFYPEYQPELDLISNPPKNVQPQWWETQANAPTPETCNPRWGSHPINGSWCQHCGWHKD